MDRSFPQSVALRNGPYSKPVLGPVQHAGLGGSERRTEPAGGPENGKAECPTRNRRDEKCRPCH